MTTLDFIARGYKPFSFQVASSTRSFKEDVRLYASVLGVFAVSYALVLSIYRLYFHPLRKYPGPALAAITSVYSHWHMINGDDHQHSLKLHNKYGPVVRYGPNHLIFIDAAAWKDIYGHRTGGKKPNKKINMASQYPGHENLIQAETEENHSRQRRIFSNAFSEQALRQQEPMFKKYVDLLITNLSDRLAQAPDAKFNLVDYYNFTTFDVMGDLTFSEPLGMLETSEYSPWVRLVFQAVKSNVLLHVSKQYPALGWLVKKFMISKILEERRIHQRFSEERVNRRMATGTDKPDIWKLVLNQKGDRVLTTKEMYTNASLFMVAGTETTATLLSGLTYYLIKNPQAMQKLRAELEEAFPGGQGITNERLAHLKYLNVCLEEALRIYPPVAIARLRISPEEGTVVAGEFVPGNTKMGITQFAAYHSETNFALPEEYHPERWLPEGKEDPRFQNDNRAAAQPFSFGPRNCLGRNMAWFEMRLIAAQMLLTFDMELCPESENWEDQKVWTLWQKKPLMVKLSRRAGVDTTSD